MHLNMRLGKIYTTETKLKTEALLIKDGNLSDTFEFYAAAQILMPCTGIHIYKINLQTPQYHACTESSQLDGV